MERCYACGEFKQENEFRYIDFLKRRLKKCIKCEVQEKAQRKKEVAKKKKRKQKEKLETIKQHGVTPNILERLTRESSSIALSYSKETVLNPLPKIVKIKYRLAKNIEIIQSIFFIFSFLAALFFLIGKQFDFIALLIVFNLIAYFINKISYKNWYSQIKQDIDSVYRSHFQKTLLILKEERQIYEKFYRTTEWRTLRDSFIKREKKRVGKFSCSYCSKILSEVEIEVDHIKPRSKFPELALEISNLALSCKSCNTSKGDKMLKDWKA